VVTRKAIAQGETGLATTHFLDDKMNLDYKRISRFEKDYPQYKKILFSCLPVGWNPLIKLIMPAPHISGGSESLANPHILDDKMGFKG